MVVHAGGVDQHLNTGDDREWPGDSIGACVAGAVDCSANFSLTRAPAWNCMGEVQYSAGAGRISIAAASLAVALLFAIATRCRFLVLLRVVAHTVLDAAPGT